MSKVYLGLDASTQSMSALAIDVASGEVVLSSSINFGADMPNYESPSGYLHNADASIVHANPLMWVDALDILFVRMREHGFKFSDVVAVSGSGQQHGSVYLKSCFLKDIENLDTSKNLAEQVGCMLSRRTSPIWMDTSTTKECAEIANAVGGNAELSRRTGSGAIERFTASQIRKFFKEEPEAYADTARIHLVSSFLCSVLAGRDCAVDYGDGAGMNLLNLETLSWDKEIAAAVADGLIEKLPACKPSATVDGTVAKYFVEKYGFNPAAKIVLWTGDNPSSLVGVGAMQDATAAISLGTSDTFFASMKDLATDPDMFGHVFGNPAGGFMSLICFRNGSLAREALKAKLAVDWTFFDKTSFEQTPVGNNGNMMIPFFSNEIAPRVDSDSPRLKGDATFEDFSDKAACVRALVEGQFMNMKLRSAWMSSAPKVIRLTGGAAKSDGMARVAADVFNAKIERMKVGNGAALGAAMRAANGADNVGWNELIEKFSAADQSKTVEPNAENAKVYEKLAVEFQKFINSEFKK